MSSPESILAPMSLSNLFFTISRKLGGEELTDVGPCGKHLKDGDVLTLAPRDGTCCENMDDMECVTFQMGDGFYW